MSQQFFVPGIPAPQGSKRHVGKGVLIESSKALGPWRDRVAVFATQADLAVLTGAVSITVTFVMPRPKSAPKRFVHAIKRPDLDKLVRGIFDALTGIAWKDDSQVTELLTRKRLAVNDEETPGAYIDIREVA